MNDKEKLLERLTGVQSSRKNYYTELKKTVQEMKKKNMQLEIINDVMKNFNIDMSMDDMLKNIYDKLKNFTSIDRICLSLFEKEDLIIENLFPADESNFFRRGKRMDVTHHHLYWQVIANRKYLFWDRYTSDYGQATAFAQEELRCVLLVPLIIKGRVIGVLSIGSIKGVNYEEGDFAFFQQLSDQLAVCIENARLYNEVLQREKEWVETFRAVSELIFVLDTKQTILRVNDAVTDFFQLKNEEMVQNSFLEVFKADGLTLEDNPVAESMVTKKQAYRQFSLRNRICECYSYPVFNEEKELYAFIVYITDVTEKRKIEAQLIHSGKLAAIGEMAAGVAHELNNPLTAILGNAQLLMRKTDQSTKAYQLLTDINDCGKRCKLIIQNLLTFSRQDEYLFQDCSLNHAVEQVLGLIRDQIEKQNIQIETYLNPTLKLVSGHQQQIGQIIINLLLNAKDALEEGQSSPKKIKIATKMRREETREWVMLSVEDNGVGIAEEKIAEIFNPFFTTKEETKGTGLGLSVSIGIAEAHGGSITVESEVGTGSVFTLKLPAID